MRAPEKIVSGALIFIIILQILNADIVGAGAAGYKAAVGLK